MLSARRVKANIGQMEANDRFRMMYGQELRQRTPTVPATCGKTLVTKHLGHQSPASFSSLLQWLLLWASLRRANQRGRHNNIKRIVWISAILGGIGQHR